MEPGLRLPRGREALGGKAVLCAHRVGRVAPEGWQGRRRAAPNNTLQRTGGTEVLHGSVVQAHVGGGAAPAAERGR